MQEKELNNVMQFLQEKEKRFREDFNLIAMLEQDYPLEIIELLIKMGNTITCSRFLFQAIVNRPSLQIDAMKLVKKYGIEFDNDYAAEALYDFVEQEKFDEANFLIDNGVDVHWHDDAIIKKAIFIAQKDELYYEILKALFNAKTY